MTNEESKKQAIKNAYGKDWVNVKPYVDENGWVTWKVVSHGVTNNLHPEEDFNLPFGFYQTKNDYGCGKFEWRPKSLQGIENNNGWIKIESENDLPKEAGTYFVYSKVYWHPFYRIDVFTGRLANSFEDGKSCFTHYQLIIKPKQPIY